MDEQKKESKRGRPTGAKNIRDVSESSNSRCRNCGSSERTRYHNTRYTDYLEKGTQFNDGHGVVIGIRSRTCECKVCSVPRMDRDKFYAPDPKYQCAACGVSPVKCIDADGNGWCADHLQDKDEADE